MIFRFPDERLDPHMPVKFELCISNSSGAMTRQIWQKYEKQSILDHVWQSISLQPIEILRCSFLVKLRATATYCIRLPNLDSVAVTVLAPWDAKMCRNLRLICRYAEMSISDYVLDSISPSIIEISWRYLAVPIRAKCSIRSWKFSLTSSTVRTVGGAKIWVWYDFRLTHEFQANW